MMKKMLTAAMSFALSAVLLTGCGGAAASQAASSAASAPASEPAASAPAESDWDYISGKGTMVMGMTIFDPMNYYDDNNTLIGFDTELAQAVCEKLGVKAEFIEIDWNNKLMELEAKNVDCLWNGMTIVEAYKDSVEYTIPYSQNYQAVVINQKNKDTYTTLESMAAANIGVEAGSAGAAVVAEDEFLSQGTITEVVAQRNNLMELKSGTLDVAVIDAVMAMASVGEGTDFEDLMIVDGIELSKEEYGVGFRKGSDVVEKVNAALQELAAEGFLEELQAKYPSVMVSLTAE